jgi:hypothetical protein
VLVTFAVNCCGAGSSVGPEIAESDSSMSMSLVGGLALDFGFATSIVVTIFASRAGFR